MTYMEALERTQRELAAYKRKVSDGYEFYQMIVDYLVLTEESLSKQIPVKCQELIEENALICGACHSPIPYWASYCPDCGQKVG